MTADKPFAGPAGERQRERSFPCSACGADLVYQPGATTLICPYCGHNEVIPRDGRAIREFALNAYVTPPKPQIAPGSRGLTPMECGACGAQIEVPPETAARPCPYCGGTLLASGDHAGLQSACEAMLPFKISQSTADTAVKVWIRGLWFAPNDLKRAVTIERFTSLYQPWWTFDSHTLSHYSGEAGHPYTVTVGSGKNQRTEARTRWSYEQGVHEEFFDDMPVPAADFREWSDKYNFSALTPYETSYLAGHSATTATRDPKRGWSDAKSRIEKRIDSTCHRLIGGDVQRNVQVVTAHRSVTYKLILLPRWQGGFRYRGKVFIVTVNGQTGKVVGDHPWSVWKISGAVLFGAALLGGAYLIFNR